MPGYSTNRIPEQHRVFIPSVSSLWSTDAPSIISSSVEKYTKEGSAEIIVSQGESVFYNTNSATINGLSYSTSTNADDVGDSISAFVWIKSNTPLIVEFSVFILYPPGVPSGSPIDSKSRSISVTSGEWTLLRLYDLPVVPDDTYNYPIGLKIKVESVENLPLATINISHPVVYGTLDFINNPTLVDLFTKLPEFIRDQDANAQPLSYQLARFLEASSLHYTEIADLVDAFVYQDISEGKNDSDSDTLSRLVSPLIAPRDYLFWLAQFSGTQIINPKTGFTPWSNLPETWQGIDLIDGEAAVPPADPNSADSTQWRALQEYNTEPAGLDEFLRWQVSNGFYGYRAGTKEAIIKSVERVLLGNKQVTYQVVTPFNWTIKVKTLKSETPDAALAPLGSSIPEIVELIEPTRPLGVLVIHELI